MLAINIMMVIVVIITSCMLKEVDGWEKWSI